MDHRLRPLLLIVSLAAASTLLVAVLLWWFQFSDYSYGRQQVRILDAPEVVDIAKLESIMGEDTPKSGSDWWTRFYGHQRTIWRFGWIAVGGAAVLTLALSLAMLTLNHSLRAECARKVR